MAAPTTNIGTVYYFISCGVPSDSGLSLSSNNGSKYFYNPANDYIIWGEPTAYPQPVTNIGTIYYATKCVVPSDPGLNLQSNAGTHFYYSSSFNCVSFCDGLSGGPTPPLSSFNIVYNGLPIIYNNINITYNGL